MNSEKVQTVRIRRAGPRHAVRTLRVEATRDRIHRTQVCGECPWKVENVGLFPAQAFVHSAETGYDMATHTFACHTSSGSKLRICAGFLLRGAADNLTVRLLKLRGRVEVKPSPEGVLFSSYRKMALANGVAPNHRALRKLRRED